MSTDLENFAPCPVCGKTTRLAQGRFVQHGECPGWFVHVKLVDQVPAELESRFTPPSELCPHPERWHSPDADSAEEEVTGLVAAFVRGLRPDFVLETGTAHGATAVHIAANLGMGGHLFTIEIDPDRAAKARSTLDGMPVTVVEADSMTWTPPDGIEFGFAWFDSLVHLRVPEFLRYRDYMRKGTIVGFHDTAPHQGPLREDIMELEKRGALLPIYLNTPRGCVFAEVT